MLSKKLGKIRLNHFVARFFSGRRPESSESHTMATVSLSCDFDEEYMLKDYSRRLARSLSQREPGPKLRARMSRIHTKLRALVLFRLIYKEIVVFGTKPGFIDVHGNYKPRLRSLIVTRQLNTQLVYQTKRRCLAPLHPQSCVKKCWNAVVLSLLVVTIVYVPVEISFLSGTESLPSEVAMMVIDYIFLTDVVVTLNTAFFNSGALVDSRRAIAINYARGTMVIDIISSFPLDLFSFSIRSKALLRYFRVFRLLKVFRAVRFHGIIKYLIKASAQSQQRVATALSRILGAMALLMLLTHLTACLWFMAATYDDSVQVNWITSGGYQDDPLSRLYMVSLYWSITVLATVGYGDITAYTIYEKILACCWMLVGAMFFSFFLSTMSSVITGLDLKGARIQEKIDVLKAYCRDLRLSNGFQRTLAKQLHESMKVSTLDQGQKLDLALMLPKSLRVTVGKSIFYNACERVTFFTQLDPIFIGNIVNMLEYRLFENQEIVYTRGSYADEVYFMGSGRVSFLIGSQPIPFRTMISGSFFGETEVMEEIPREYTAVSDDSTEAFVLGRKVTITQALAVVIDEFPEVAGKLALIAKQRKEMCLGSVIKCSNAISVIEKNQEEKGQISYDKVLTNKQIRTELNKLEKKLKMRATEAKTVREELFDLAVVLETLRRASKVLTMQNAAMEWDHVQRRISDISTQPQ